ncbi:synaptic plasticity regulator PANTS [Rhynchophorus ferrugineus]|uniref:Synaptic plasticity regulator PANTS n=1 Tax=Rhynchophorus ferrugineus TaxID=354439 RepID=A0A834MDR5_RHYFE|nr:hypothetical protein GWI33_010892 [Rhynchophorus ferrugineus]
MSSEELENKKPTVKDEWMIRQCARYDEEYSECTSFKVRFHQLFIFGKTLDCSQWKKDSVNCYKWVDDKDVRAANELVASEVERRKQRLLPHYQNNVWTKRKEPPENWNCPLPDHLREEYEGSYLDIKSKEMKGEIPASFDPTLKHCTIL